MAKQRWVTTVLKIERAYSQVKGCPGFEIQLMPNSRAAKCARCGRGVVLRWSWGKEPEISDCKVCKAKTTVKFTARTFSISEARHS